jgi:hypothetical protein
MATLEFNYVQEHLEELVDNIERDGPHLVVQDGKELGWIIPIAQVRELQRIKRLEAKKRSTRAAE